MTNFEKVKSYYSIFDEWGRLDAPQGKLEFDLTMPIIINHLPPQAELLDLGGGPGRYTIELAKHGYDVHLADLSRTLLDEAEKRISEYGVKNVKSVRQVNAMDLSIYGDCSFDAVLLLGPLYHLTAKNERASCIKEVRRVLKPGGIVFASFIPYLSGAIGIAARMFLTPDQVSAETLRTVFGCGIFNNKTDRGFQEAFFPTSGEVVALFAEHGFSKILLRSVRGWGDRIEEQIYNLKNESPQMYATVIDIINQTACNTSIVEMCSHAIYVGKRDDTI